MSEIITLEEIIGFFEKDIKASEKRTKQLKEDKTLNKITTQIQITCNVQEETTLRYVISTLKKFINQKNDKPKVIIGDNSKEAEIERNKTAESVNINNVKGKK